MIQRSYDEEHPFPLDYDRWIGSTASRYANRRKQKLARLQREILRMLEWTADPADQRCRCLWWDRSKLWGQGLPWKRRDRRRWSGSENMWLRIWDFMKLVLYIVKLKDKVNTSYIKHSRWQHLPLFHFLCLGDSHLWLFHFMLTNFFASDQEDMSCSTSSDGDQSRQDWITEHLRV